MNRVVVTGIGAVTPIGNDAQTTWKGMKSGKNGIGFITRFDTEEFKVKVAAEVKNFDPTLYLEKKEIRKTDLYTVRPGRRVPGCGGQRHYRHCGAGTAGSLCRLWNRRHDHLCGKLQKAV